MGHTWDYELRKPAVRMAYYYDEEYIWPSEKLYRFIINKYMTSKKLSKWIGR